MPYRQLFAEELAKQGAFPRCYAFSLHKSGSSLMHTMISQVCTEAGLPAVNIPGKLFLNGLREGWSDNPDVLGLLGEGRVYYGYRFLPPILREPAAMLRERRSVLLVRDPRDALVSLYFSVGGKYFSHRLPNRGAEEFRSMGDASKDMDIDQFVLSRARLHLRHMNDYREALDFDQVLLRRYEQIYFDKRNFLGEIFDHFGLAVPADVLDRVAAAHDVRPQAENPNQHIRKGTPGDHREKLRPETIARLNEIFADTATWYGYRLEA